VLHELDDGRPALRIACGRDDPGRLVQQHVPERLRDEEPPVEIDDVALLDERVQPGRHAVDPHAAPLDQLVGAAPGGDTSAGKVRVQAHRRSFTLATVRSHTCANFRIRIASGRRWAVP
jgi:hypothetical protein